MDEAGYGPNLGPLVVTATVWEVPEDPDNFNFWKACRGAVRRKAGNDGRLHVADSKVVYQPARGLGELERSVLALTGLLGEWPRTWRELRDRVVRERHATSESCGPWHAEDDVELPTASEAKLIDSGHGRIVRCLDKCGVKLRAICSDMVAEERFNRMTAAAGSKGAALTEISLSLLACCLPEDVDQPVLVLADKHGGRNCYSGPLTEATGGRFITILEESRERSRYRAGACEFRFEPRGERHLPIAVASMVSKYLREVSMITFNRFWQRHIPTLKPTKGYPGDSRRFWKDIRATQQSLGIADDLLWRRL
jgi:hypothetical protein